MLLSSDVLCTFNVLDKSFRVKHGFLNEQEQFYTFCHFQKKHFQRIYFRYLFQNPNFSCHGIVVFCVQYIDYMLKRNDGGDSKTFQLIYFNLTTRNT